MTFAFLRLQHVEDLFDLIALLKRGAVVGLEPVPGSIFGPTVPCKIAIEPVERVGFHRPGGRGVFRVQAADLETFEATSTKPGCSTS